MLTAVLGKGIYDAISDAKNDPKSRRRFFGNVNHEDNVEDVDTRANRISMNGIAEAIRQRDGSE